MPRSFFYSIPPPGGVLFLRRRKFFVLRRVFLKKRERKKKKSQEKKEKSVRSRFKTAEKPTKIEQKNNPQNIKTQDIGWGKPNKHNNRRTSVLYLKNGQFYLKNVKF